MKPIVVMRARGVAASGGGMSFPNYAAYQEYVLALTVTGSLYTGTVSGYQIGSQVGGGVTRWRVDDGSASASGSMYGSPRASNRAVTQDSTATMVMRHIIESLPALTTAPNVFLFDANAGAYSGYESVSYNGYTSYAYAPSYNGRVINSAVYWDYSLGKARKFDATTLTYSDYTG